MSAKKEILIFRSIFANLYNSIVLKTKCRVYDYNGAFFYYVESSKAPIQGDKVYNQMLFDLDHVYKDPIYIHICNDLVYMKDTKNNQMIFYMVTDTFQKKFPNISYIIEKFPILSI